jgi:hypothetical protein
VAIGEPKVSIIACAVAPLVALVPILGPGPARYARTPLEALKTSVSGPGQNASMSLSALLGILLAYLATSLPSEKRSVSGFSLALPFRENILLTADSLPGSAPSA